MANKKSRNNVDAEKFANALEQLAEKEGLADKITQVADSLSIKRDLSNSNTTEEE
jgi:hypothetical protein